MAGPYWPPWCCGSPAGGARGGCLFWAPGAGAGVPHPRRWALGGVTGPVGRFSAPGRGVVRGGRETLFPGGCVTYASSRSQSELPEYGAPPGLPCPTPRASAARGFNRLQGIVEDNPLSTGDHHGGPRSSVFGVPANQLPETSSCSPARRLATELRHRGGVVPSGGRRQAIYGCPSSSVGSSCARTEDGLLAAPCCCGRSTEPDATWRSRFSVV